MPAGERGETVAAGDRVGRGHLGRPAATEPVMVRAVQRALLEHDAVADALVVVDGDRLVGYVVTDTEVVDIAAHLARRLPRYLVPAVIVPLDELPGP